MFLDYGVPLELFLAEKSFSLKMTGQQGDVMKESISVAQTVAWHLLTMERQKKLEERENWGLSWADRCLTTSFPTQAVEYGYATWEELEAISEGWRHWSANPDGYFQFITGEAIAEVQ